MKKSQFISKDRIQCFLEKLLIRNSQITHNWFLGCWLQNSAVKNESTSFLLVFDLFETGRTPGTLMNCVLKAKGKQAHSLAYFVLFLLSLSPASSSLSSIFLLLSAPYTDISVFTQQNKKCSFKIFSVKLVIVMFHVILFSHSLRNSPLEPQFSDYSHHPMKNELIKICDVIISMAVVTICSSKILQCVIQFF